MRDGTERQLKPFRFTFWPHGESNFHSLNISASFVPDSDSGMIAA
jgi:hypothetical protein